MHEQQITAMLNAIFEVVAETNRYFAGQEPWALRKNDPARFETVLYVTADVLRQVAILLQAVMPESAGRLLDLLAVPEDKRMFDSLGAGGRLGAGTPLPPPMGVFPRYVEPEAPAA
jgi:methionyl-tRNA synthetase